MDPGRGQGSCERPGPTKIGLEGLIKQDALVVECSSLECLEEACRLGAVVVLRLGEDLSPLDPDKLLCTDRECIVIYSV